MTSLILDTIEVLTPPEVWLLDLGFVFHDIAMGRIPPHEDVAKRIRPDEWRDLVATTFFEMLGHWPDDSEIDDPPAEVRKACETWVIRRSHAARAADLALKPWIMNGREAYVIVTIHVSGDANM